MHPRIPTLSNIGWILGLLGIISLAIGIPGLIDDATTWARWLRVVYELPALPLAVGSVVTGFTLWISKWWYPSLHKAIRKSSGSKNTSSSRVSNEIDLATQPDTNLAKFEACLPHINRCRIAIRPLIGPVGAVGIAGQVVVGDRAPLIELQTELSYLASKLSRLGIQGPTIPSGADKSISDVKLRFERWNEYLAELGVAIKHGDLESARKLEP